MKLHRLLSPLAWFSGRPDPAAARVFFIVLALGLFLSPLAHGKTHKFAVIVGNNLGANADEQLDWAESDARKFHRVLVQLGSFAPENTVLLLGGSSRQLWGAIERIEQRIASQEKAPGDRSLFLFYFSGHAAGDVLELGATSANFGKLREHLEESEADVRLGFLDSCESGRIINLKGGRPGPQYQIEVTDEITANGFAIITSSADDELSQESAEIRGAFFTHYLISALRGAGDESRDGKVTLTEAYQYAYSRTLARTSATTGGGQHPMYHFELSGRGQIVLTNTAQIDSSLEVTLPEAGRLVLMDAAGELIISEADLLPGQPTAFSVAPSEYLVYLVTPEGAVRAARLRVASGGSTRVAADDFESVDLHTAVPRGGLFARSWQQHLGAGVNWRRFVLQDAWSSYGAALRYRLTSPKGLAPMLRLSWSTSPGIGDMTSYHDVGAGLGLGYAFRQNRWSFVLSAFAGYEHLFQDTETDGLLTAPAFNYLGLAEIQVPFSEFTLGFEVGAGGRMFEVLDTDPLSSEQSKTLTHRMDLLAGLTIAWQL